MINFKLVRWKNVLSTGNAFTTVRLDERMTTLIVGENGAGKSTILDALCFALYGKPFRKIKKDQLINSVNQREAVVEIEFSTRDHSYKIIRGIKPNVFEIYEDGRLLDQDAAARDYQESLEKNILKLSMKSFCQIVILGSTSFVPFMQLAAHVRREVIEDLLDIGVFSSMAMLLKERVATSKENIKLNARDIENNGQNISIQEKLRDDLKQQSEDKTDEYHNRIETARKRLLSYEAEVADLEDSINVLLEEVTDKDIVSSRIQKILNLESNLEKKRTNAKKTIKFYTDNDECPTCTQNITDSFKSEKIKEKEETIGEIETALEKMQSELQTSETRLSEITRIQRKISDSQHLLRDAQTNIKSTQKEISLWTKEIEDNAITNRLFNDEIINKLLDDKRLLLDKKADLLREFEMFDLATAILRDSGIKSRIIKQYVPVINTLVNKYLAAMDFFVKFELDENFEERILSRHRDDFTYASFSEGEKMRIDLALLFTWRAIARMKNSANTNLLILDEVFDASLDNNGCDEFLKLIGNLDDTNVFVISHKGDVLLDKFQATIRFNKQKNFSRIAA